FERISCCRRSYVSPDGARTLIHSGRRSGRVSSDSGLIRSRVGVIVIRLKSISWRKKAGMQGVAAPPDAQITDHIFLTFNRNPCTSITCTGSFLLIFSEPAAGSAVHNSDPTWTCPD